MKYYYSKDARNNLINNKNWTFEGDSYSVCNPNTTYNNDPENNFTLYFKPNSDVLRIEFQVQIKRGSQISLLDFFGKSVLELSLSPGLLVSEIRLSELISGTYFVQLICQGRLITTKKMFKTTY